MKKFNVFLMAGLMYVCFAASSVASMRHICPPEYTKKFPIGVSVSGKFSSVSITTTDELNKQARCLYTQGLSFVYGPGNQYRLLDGDKNYWTNLTYDSSSSVDICNGTNNLTGHTEKPDASKCPFYQE
jgi:hypothetical protein